MRRRTNRTLPTLAKAITIMIMRKGGRVRGRWEIDDRGNTMGGNSSPQSAVTVPCWSSDTAM
jgi:hypothetical protein